FRARNAGGDLGGGAVAGPRATLEAAVDADGRGELHRFGVGAFADIDARAAVQLLLGGADRFHRELFRARVVVAAARRVDEDAEVAHHALRRVFGIGPRVGAFGDDDGAVRRSVARGIAVGRLARVVRVARAVVAN